MAPIRIHIYTDGSCFQNDPTPSPGGASAVITAPDHPNKPDKARAAFCPSTTSEEMEFLAIYIGLDALSIPPEQAGRFAITVFTDYKVAIGAMTANWKMKAPHLRRLRDTTLKLIEERGLQVAFEKVEAHAGDTYNERAGQIAYAFAALGKDQDGNLRADKLRIDQVLRSFGRSTG